MVKNHLPVQKTQETHVQSLGGEDPLEKAMATRSSTLAWRLPWTEGPGGCSPGGVIEHTGSWLTLLRPSLLRGGAAQCYRCADS